MDTQKRWKATFLLGILVLMSGVLKAQTTNTFKLTSQAFQEGKPIPAKYTCDGDNILPSLNWNGAPEKTRSFAIIMDDPDAPMGTWVHWVIYNIPGTFTKMEENQRAEQINAIDGLNSANEKGYYGPCPPVGTHRYVFKLYALDKMLTPTEGMWDPLESTCRHASLSIL